MMKEDNFIYKLLLFIQVWLCSILITHLLVKYNVLIFSNTRGIFLFQFVLSCIILTIITLLIIAIIILSINRIKNKIKKKNNNKTKRLLG